VTSHPLFTRVYAVLAAAGEHVMVGRWRTEALRGARGRLLVVGCGPGHDFAHLPATVTEVVAVEPDPTMRAMARRRAQRVSVPVHIVDATAEDLPLHDDSVDAVLMAYLLCSVADPVASLAEAHRVLQPDGTLHLLEHVRGADDAVLTRVQDRLVPLWQRCAGGCRLDRRTRSLLEAAGFDTAEVRGERLAVLPPIAPHLVGVARPRE
jgi:ubiquinone/menaquinone biosynthesis C-methylase UbiE